MLLRQLKVALFVNADPAALQQAVNDVTAGLAVLLAVSGTVDYPAKWVDNKRLIDQQWHVDAGTYTCALFYAVD